MNIYVGNFAKDVTSEDLKEIFEAFGEVASVTIIKDKFSDESRGFGFVEMPSNEAAQEAIDTVKEIKGKTITINEARPKSDNRGRSRRDFKETRGRGPRQEKY